MSHVTSIGLGGSNGVVSSPCGAAVPHVWEEAPHVTCYLHRAGRTRPLGVGVRLRPHSLPAGGPALRSIAGVGSRLFYGQPAGRARSRRLRDFHPTAPDGESKCGSARRHNLTRCRATEPADISLPGERRLTSIRAGPPAGTRTGPIWKIGTWKILLLDNGFLILKTAAAISLRGNSRWRPRQIGGQTSARYKTPPINKIIAR